MKMNLIVRIKNPVFWFTIIPATATFAYVLMGCFDIVAPISQDALVNALIAVVEALATLGVLVDPTTKGVGDSENALTYSEPK